MCLSFQKHPFPSMEPRRLGICQQGFISHHKRRKQFQAAMFCFKYSVLIVSTVNLDQMWWLGTCLVYPKCQELSWVLSPITYKGQIWAQAWQSTPGNLALGRLSPKEASPGEGRDHTSEANRRSGPATPLSFREREASLSVSRS